ncbi:MAG TPA: hypothetical protein VGK68_09690 [Gaiellaceae bacterium]
MDAAATSEIPAAPPAPDLGFDLLEQVGRLLGSILTSRIVPRLPLSLDPLIAHFG